jgi:hypothetical protein
MRTPAGTECRFFYGNYYRGKRQEECRLIGDQPPPQPWTPAHGRNCPEPGFLRANACPHMSLKAIAERGPLGLNKRVKVSAYCDLAQKAVDEPYIGCGLCHPLPSEFTDNQDDANSAA